jgi:uncharacterized membrane protein
VWIAEGWKLFARAPLMWIVGLILVLLVMMALGFIPILGNIAFQLMQPVIAGGFVVACRSLEKGGEFELEHLLTGFSRRLWPLLIVGLLFLLAWAAIIGVVVLVVGLAWFTTGDPSAAVEAMSQQPLTVLLLALVVLALGLPIMAAYWFAPALVMMHDMKPMAAMKESFFACFRNLVPFMLYSIVMLVGFFLAVIPFGLGLLVFVPVFIASTYVAYRQIFTEA